MLQQANFDRVARPYQLLEYLTLGRALERCRLHFVDQLQDRSHALVLGDGDGRFLAALLKSNTKIFADAVDTSQQMLSLLSLRCKRNGPGRFETHCADARVYAASAEVDLVTAHFFFDCFPQRELDALIARLAKQVGPGTVWVVSDFRIPNGLLGLPAAAFVRLLYLGFRLITGLRTTRLPNHDESLRQAGLYRTDRHLSFFGLLTTELWHSGTSRS